MNNMQKARKKHTEYSNQKGRPSADRRIEVVESAKVKDNILQGIEEIIEHSNVPKDKKMELKKKLKSVASENLKKPFSKDVDDKIKIGMEKIIDELPMPRTERNKLKNALTNMVEDHVDNLRGAETQKFTTQQDKFIKVDDKPLQDIFQKTEGAIEEAPVPTEKKNELKKKLKKLTIKDYKKIPLEDEAEPPTDEMIEIINELNLPKDKKTKLQSAVTNATNEYKSNIKTATRDKCTKYTDEKGRPKSIDEAYAVKVKDTILQGIEEITEDSNIPKEKKMELTRKLKNIVNENLKKPFSENVDEKIKIGVDKIIDDLPIPKTERNKLKSALTNMVDENIDNLRGATQITSQEDKLLKVDDKPLHDVFQEMERAIEEAPLPREKKSELKKKLKKLTTKDYNTIPLEDVVEPPTDDIMEIVNELNLPKDKKTKLKSAVTNATDEYINNMRTKARDKYTANLDEPLRDYFKETERAIEEAPLPREKKIEMKQKLKKVTTKDYNKISMEEVAKPLTDEMIEIIDEMNLPKDKKSKLKSGLTTATDEYMSNVRTATKVKDTEAPDRPLREIFREIERAIEESPLPREKKNELKQKLKKMTSKDYSKIPLEDVAKPPTDDIVEIIDELNLPKDKKNNLKSAVTTAADEYMSNVRTAAKDKYNEYPDQPLHEAFQGIERAIEESQLSREKKNEMKKKLKKLTNKDYNKIPLEEVAKPPIDDMTEIIDDLNLPKDKTNNLKSALNAATDKYMSNVRTAAKEKYKEYPDQPLHEYFQEIERTIEDSSLPREKKNELKKKLKKLTTKDFNTIPLEETPIGDMTEIIDEMNLPKDKRNKLINALNTVVDKYKSNMQTDQRRRSSVKTKYKKTDKDLKPIERVDVAEVKNNIFQGIEKITEDSNIPKEKKIELKRKLKNIAAENLKKPFSKDMQDTIKNDIAEIINELPISKTEKNQLNNALTNMLDENIYHLNEVEDKPLHNVFKYMKRAIGEAPVTKEKKVALKKKLQDLATKDYNDISVEDLAEALKDGMIDIINELNLPNDKKNILKNDVANMIEENTFILQSEPGEEPSDVDGIQRNIIQGFEEVIDEAPIPRDIRTELKKDLKEIANKNFKKPWSDDVAIALKDDIDTIIEDTNLPKDKKNNLKNELIAVVNENMGQTKPAKLSRYQKKLAQSSGPRFIIDETDVKGSMKKEVKKTVQKSDIGDADKSQLNLQLLRMISGMLAEFDEDLDERLKQIFEKYGIDPSYQNTLLEEYNKLLEIILKGGDIEDARRKLIEKLMRDLGLSEEVATALVDELIALAREIAQQEGIDDILKSHESLIRVSKKSVKAFDEIDKIQQPSRAPDYTGDGQKKTLTAKQAQEFQTALNLEISSILNDYQICCDKRDLLPKLVNELMKLRNSGIDQDEIVENLVDTINRITYLRGDPAEELAYKLLYRTKKLIATIRGDVPVKKRDFKDAVMNDVGDVFQGSSMSESKRRMMENQLAEGYAKDLGIPLEDSYGTMTGQDSESKKDSYGMSFNGLSNYIDTWLSSIPDDETKDEDEIMDMKKQRMYCLMHKIGEMNVDPEIFNDDSLYEAVLREEIQHLFGDVSANDEEFKALKEDLIEKVLEAQRRAHDELAGQNYKNNLRDTISKLLPDQRNLSKEDKATMETLKDQLADAYIDLHYSGDNEYQRDKLKRKISNEINTFCRDYLNRNPCSPLNSQKLNRDLYAALSKVPLPPGDSIRYEVEQARIREEINDWVKELPLQPQSPTELLARNKLIYVLSKKLFDIEVDEQEEDPDNDMMRKKIVTFLNKLPLESDEDNETIADRLIDKLKSSEESRKYNASSNVTIDASGKVSAANSDSGMSPICPGYKPLLDRRKPCVFPKLCKRAPPKQSEAFPPCTLSPEDRDHLDRIRRRTCLSPNCVTSLMRKNKCPFGLGSPATNMGSQTVLKPFSIEDQQQNRICPFSNRPCPRASANLPHQPCPPVRTEAFQTEKTQPSTLCPAAFEKMPRTCPAGPMRSSQPCQGRRPTLSSSNVSDCTEEVQPQIVIKQYYWDPLNKNSIDLSTEEAQQTGRCNRRSDSITGHSPPRATPCTSPRPTSCRPPPCPPPRPAPCTTFRPPPCKPPPCYSSRPPTCHSSLPCETRTTCPQPAPGPCRRPSSGKQPTACSRPKSPRQNSSERYSFFDPLNSFQRSSHIINSRSPCTPSPCMSPFGINQCPPPGSLGFSKRFNECRMPKRDGLQEQVPSDTSRPSQKERVIELGSLDDVGSRPKKRHSDQSDWPKFHEDDNFWAAPMRRVILDEGIDESLVMERERREERVTCKCKERLVPKCSRPPPGTIPNPPGSQSSEEGQNLKRCSKCCGIHCPYPSFLYFRQ